MEEQLFNKEPEFIQESEELGILRQAVTAPLLKQGLQNGHINMAFDLLKQTLHQCYRACSISTLVTQSVIISEANTFSSVAREAIRKAEWARSTTNTVWCILKKILCFTAISSQFLKRLSIREMKHDHHPELGRYNSLNFPARNTLGIWSNKIRKFTRNKSPHSIKNIIRFIMNKCLPVFNLDVNLMPVNPSEYIANRISEAVIMQICEMKRSKLNWLQFFLKYIMEYKIPLKVEWLDLIDKTKENRLVDQDDGSDKHRISIKELEKLYEATKDCVEDRLMFMIFITTGIRIGGMSKIKTEHVAHVSGTDVVILATGRSIEKGNKWFSFILAPQVKELLFVWITSHRPAVDSPYLFPGRNEHVSTSNIRYRFKKIAQKAGLVGAHLHPHALRHTYAHMILETGNTVDTVSKLMGHVSSKTTESFYLKESAVEVAKRANIPWLDKSNTPLEPVIPDFLQNNKSQIDKKQSKLRNKRRKVMASLEMFQAGPLPAS
jgi:integrase